MEKETVKAYLISELWAELLSEDPESRYEWDEIVQLDGGDLTEYEEPIREQIRKENEGLEENGNLACYLEDPSEDLREKVIRIQTDVAVYEGELYGCTVLEFKEEPSEREWDRILDYIFGQFSDGWGEGFEQRDIQVAEGILNVHFWEDDLLYRIESQDPRTPQAPQLPAKPKMKLLGEDGNIFAILGRAGRLLRENGQGELVQEMTRRVQESRDYYKALNIISEYVQTEPSKPSGAEERTPKQDNRSQPER